jgi:hypothetical protein
MFYLGAIQYAININKGEFMELYIKSEDGSFCGVIKEVHYECKLNENTYVIIGVTGSNKTVLLGDYKSPEFCLKVINEIFNKLKNMSYIKILGSNMIKPKALELLKEKNREELTTISNPTLTSNIEIIEKSSDYFEMPKE